MRRSTCLRSISRSAGRAGALAGRAQGRAEVEYRVDEALLYAQGKRGVVLRGGVDYVGVSKSDMNGDAAVARGVGGLLTSLGTGGEAQTRGGIVHAVE